jgi:diguanylate cyclase (GGDEF)-like protein
MGVELPGNRQALLPAGTVRAVAGRSRRSLWWSAMYFVLGLAVLVALRTRPDSGWLLDPPWGLAPVLAVIAWLRAARRSHDSRSGSAFRLMAIAGAAGVLSFVAWMGGGPPLPGEGIPVAALLLFVPSFVIPAGAAALAPRRRHFMGPALIMDALLLLVVGAAATLRLVVEPTLAEGSASWIDAAAAAMLQIVALLPVLAAFLLVLGRGSMLAPRSAVLLLTSTLAFAAAAFLSLRAHGVVPFRPGDPSALFWAAGWFGFAASGLAARDSAPTAGAMLTGRRTFDALRRLIVPGVALILALAVLDLGLGRDPRPETVMIVALLGMALSFRTGHAFSLADREAQQRRQLAHTQALVEVTHSLAGATDLDVTLRVIGEAARSVFGTRGAGIELLSADGQSLETRYVVGLSEGILGLRFPVDGSFTGWVVRNGQPRATVDPSTDPYVLPVSLDYLGRSPMAAAPIRFREETLGVLYACIRAEPFDAEELELMGALAQQAAIAIDNARLFEQVTVLSLTDPLTGLANRRELEKQLDREFAAACRGRSLVATIFDLDEFKTYNDSHGHLAGDEALRALADCLRTETRTMNLAARYGGDEFVVLLSGADALGAEAFITRVRTRFEARVADLGHGDLTVSIGAAAYSEAMATPGDLVRAADQDLYRSKSRASST